MGIEKNNYRLKPGEAELWVKALYGGIDQHRNGLPTGAYSPQTISVDDFLWSRNEVEAALMNGLKAGETLNDNEARFLRGFVSNHPEVTREWGDDAEAMQAEYDQKVERSFRAHPHHIDLFFDVLVWLTWLLTEQDSKLVVSVVTQKIEGRKNIKWYDVQSATGFHSVQPASLNKRYKRNLDALVCKLTEMRYPRRRKA